MAATPMALIAHLTPPGLRTRSGLKLKPPAFGAETPRRKASMSKDAEGDKPRRLRVEGVVAVAWFMVLAVLWYANVDPLGAFVSSSSSSSSSTPSKEGQATSRLNNHSCLVGSASGSLCGADLQSDLDRLQRSLEDALVKQALHIKTEMQHQESHLIGVIDRLKSENDRLSSDSASIKAELARIAGLQQSIDQEIAVRPFTDELAKIEQTLQMKMSGEIDPLRRQLDTLVATAAKAAADAAESDKRGLFSELKEAVLKATLQVVPSREDLAKVAREQALLASEWKNMAHDGTGLRDFAALSMGASVDIDLTTPTYRRSGGMLLEWLVWGHGPDAALRPDETCWRCSVANCTLAVKLRRAVIANAVSLEHTSHVVEDPFLAPRKFEVLSRDSDGRLIVAGRGEYKKDEGLVQTFSLDAPSAPSRTLALRVLSAYSDLPYVCVKRFRVHGRWAA